MVLANQQFVAQSINQVEDALMRSGEFKLPGKKALKPSDTLIEVILVDVGELNELSKYTTDTPKINF